MKKLLLFLSIPLLFACTGKNVSGTSGRIFSDTLYLRFADSIEARGLLLADDVYRRNLSPFDIVVRVGNAMATREQLDSLSAAGAMEWSNNDKERVLQVAKMFNDTIRKYQMKLPFPGEVIVVKTDMKDQGKALGYTRGNWIALSGEALPDISREALFELLVHESFHILTRNSISFKRDIYSTIGFTVTDGELLFPSDLRDVRISNPDVGLYDSYAVFSVNGQLQKCAMLLYSSKPYTGGNMFSYINVGFVPYDEEMRPVCKGGGTVLYSYDEIDDFFDKIGCNTTYTLHPEEILAKNFVFAIQDVDNLKTPQLKERIRDVLIAGQ